MAANPNLTFKVQAKSCSFMLTTFLLVAVVTSNSRIGMPPPQRTTQRRLGSYSNIFVGSRAGAGGGCSLSDEKKEKFCKKGCKSKSSNKCKARKNKLKKCCNKNCKCKDNNKNFVNETEVVERCSGVTPYQDINVQREKRLRKRYWRKFSQKVGSNYTFERRRGTNGIWGEWTDYIVVNGDFWESNPADFQACGTPELPALSCDAWNVEDLMDVILSGIQNHPPQNNYSLIFDYQLHDVKYNRKKGFPRMLKYSPASIEFCSPWEIEMRRVRTFNDDFELPPLPPTDAPTKAPSPGGLVNPTLPPSPGLVNPTLPPSPGLVAVTKMPSTKAPSPGGLISRPTAEPPSSGILVGQPSF